MSVKVEMCFCMLKKNGNVFNEFTDIICKSGWLFSKSNEVSWPYGPVNSNEYYKTDKNGRREDLLVELYTYSDKYDEYLFVFRPTNIVSTDKSIEYSISEDYYNLIKIELENFDFYCGNMGLESYGFEINTQDNRYDVSKGKIEHLTDSLLELAYISEECRKNDYDVNPSALERYEKTDLNKGRMYIAHKLVDFSC